MSLVSETFQGFYPGTFLEKRAFPEITGTIAAAASTIEKPTKIALKRLNQRDAQTDAPEGALAVMKDQILARLTLRKRKMRRPLLRRSVQGPLFQKSLLLAA